MKVKKSKSILRFTFDNEPNGLTWKQEKGDVKSVDGRWELSELDANRTKAVYALEIDPGRVLGMLLRGPVEGQVKEYLTKGAAEGLKSHFEAAPQAPRSLRRLPRRLRSGARVGKLVKPADLKSAARKGIAGSSPAPGTSPR